jgi:hypothetical protein
MLPEAETRKNLSAEIDLVAFDFRTNSVGSFCKFTSCQSRRAEAEFGSYVPVPSPATSPRAPSSPVAAEATAVSRAFREA